MGGNLPNLPDPGAWWDPRNWSAGGQKIFGAGPGAGASTPQNAPNLYAGSTPKAVAGKNGKSDIGTSTSETSDEDRWTALIQQMFDELNMPWDPNDPANKMLLDNIRASTVQSANNQGIFGPYSNNMAEQAMFKAQAPLAAQKKGMAMNALGMGVSQANNQRDFRYGVDQDKYTNAMDLWKFNQGQNQSVGGMVGGGIGGIIGGIAGGPAGASAGWGIGSGVGSMFGGSGGSPPPTFRPSGGY